MTRPAAISKAEYFALSPEAQQAHNAEWAAWDATPEGQTELAAKLARKLSAFETERIAMATKIFTGTDAWRPAGARLNLAPRAVAIVLAGGLQETPALAAVHGASDLLVLAGGVGCGKTVAAVERCREFIFKPAHWNTYDADKYETEPRFKADLPVWTTASELARVDHYSEPTVRRYMDAPLLVVDDLGAEFSDGKGFFTALLDEVIDARYASKRATIFTTNADSTTFTARYGQRIIDRLREAGRFINCGNVSLRRATP